MMDQATARKLQQVGKAFHLPGPFFSYEEILNGNVNRTYKVNYISDDGTGMAVIKPYLVQKINSYAFHNPDELMSNIDRVTEFIRTKRPDKTCMHFHHTDVTGERKTYLEEGDSFWRIYKYIAAETVNKCDDPLIVRRAGKAFGDFQMVLSDFDVSQLFYTIPDFHDTRKRYEKLIADANADPCGRVAEVRAELDYLFSVQQQACRLTDLYNEGKLPLRVTHNDTKINNVLFDEKTHEPLVVIDLDTVMPGLVGHDFGDGIRFAANFTEEDAEDTTKTGVDLNIFFAFADGFLSETAKMLTEEEVDTLALSCFAITCELATRFLDDYLIGDKYFKVKRAKHNLIRTRCQVALAKDMQTKLDAMDAIVKSCVKKYR
ncbi:MAG: aminoglycoside phosphotransferase family protein [Oscillospiraceae bacterium]|nr:aminoglycoside phosphotransferase family protein [Oscillospiraceae bacterium]